MDTNSHLSYETSPRTRSLVDADYLAIFDGKFLHSNQHFVVSFYQASKKEDDIDALDGEASVIDGELEVHVAVLASC